MGNILVQKQKVEDLYLSSDVVTGINGVNLKRLEIPFHDFIIKDSMYSCVHSLSVVNYSNNNINTYYCPEYGGPETVKYQIHVVIPTTVDNEKQFNEFYVNFAMCDYAKVNVKFYLSKDQNNPIAGLPQDLTDNYMFHFFENKDNEYLIQWDKNTKESVQIIEPQ